MDVQAGQQQPAQPPAVSRTRGLVSGPDESGHRRVTPGPPAVASPADVDHEGSLGTGQEPFTVGPREQACTVTRGRPYQHNDNAHNEQRNGDWVRKHAFRHRYETDAELALLNQLWALVMARKNPAACVKATGWTQTSAGRKKRIYDKPPLPRWPEDPPRGSQGRRPAPPTAPHRGALKRRPPPGHPGHPGRS